MAHGVREDVDACSPTVRAARLLARWSDSPVTAEWSTGAVAAISHHSHPSSSSPRATPIPRAQLPWACASCTFANPPTATACEICCSPKPPPTPSELAAEAAEAEARAEEEARAEADGAAMAVVAGQLARLSSYGFVRPRCRAALEVRQSNRSAKQSIA